MSFPPMMTPDELSAHMQDEGGYDAIVVVDARYNYEYEGGHITGAKHFTKPEELVNTVN